MKLFHYYFVGILFFCLGCKTSIDNIDDTTSITVLKGATIFDGTGKVYENGIIVIADGRIYDIGGSDLQYPNDAEVIDLMGKYITPGLIDTHVHFFQTAFFDSRPDAFNLRDSFPYQEVYDYQMNHPQRYYEAYLRSGITAVYDVGAFNATFNFTDDSENNPNAVHVVTSGPLLTPFSYERISGFNVQNDSVMYHLNAPEVGRNHVKKMADKDAVGIKIWSLNINDSTFMNSLAATTKEAENYGKRLIVHATTLAQAKAALRFNPRLLVHSVSDTLIDQEFLDLAKANKTYYNPTMVVGRGYYNTYKALMGDEFKIKDSHNVVDAKTLDIMTNINRYKSYVTDTTAFNSRMKRMDKQLIDERKIMSANLKSVYEAEIPIVVGTDAGNPGTLHGISIYDEMEAMQAAGLEPGDIIVMATKNGSEVILKEDEIGTLETGKIADLIILNENPNQDISNMRSITKVMRMGVIMDVNEGFQKD